MDAIQQQLLLDKRRRYETSHILHLLLSVVTVGFWIPVWIVVAIINHVVRDSLDSRLNS